MSSYIGSPVLLSKGWRNFTSYIFRVIVPFIVAIFWSIGVFSVAIGIALIAFDYGLAGVGFLGISVVLICIAVVHQAWFSSKYWKYRTSDDKTRWEPYFDNNKKKPFGWEVLNQKENMFYEIDLREKRKVIEVYFSDGMVNKVPEQSRFWFKCSTQSHEPLIRPNGSRHPYVVIG